MNPRTYQGRKVPGPCRSCLRGGPNDPCPINCGPAFRFRRKRQDPDPLALGFEAWRRGYNRDANPFVSGHPDAKRWLKGHEMAREEHNEERTD